MPPEPDMEMTRRVLAMCRGQGFALAGVCPARASDHADHVRAWLAAGKHGEMSYLAENIEKRLDPAKLVRGARSIIMVADQYAARGDLAAAPTEGPGRIARYARGEDYHEAMKGRLQSVRNALRNEFTGHRFRSFIDTAPVLEREHAARAGLGWIGKHTLLIHPRLGSWLFLGGIITTLRLPVPAEQESFPDHCGTCTRCLDACPTGAITPYSVDASRCISYLTIEHRSPIAPAFHGPMGDWLYGCDVCQEVCPHNSPRAEKGEVGTARPEYAPRREGLPPAEVLGWTEADRRRVVAGSAMHRATLEMFKRNARIVAHHQPGGAADRA